jgi:hypothetical protein
VFAEELAWARGWAHAVGNDGASIALTLPDGRAIDGARVRGVLNRIALAPSDQLVLSRPGEREYALHELSAFFLSWLHSLPGPVLNRPTPQGLCGRWRPPAELAWLAGRAGFRVADYVRVSSADDGDGAVVAAAAPTSGLERIVVLRGRPFGGKGTPGLNRSCRTLAELAQTELLGVDLAVDADEPVFAGATPLPDLTAGGDALLDALAEALRGNEGGGA